MRSVGAFSQFSRIARPAADCSAPMPRGCRAHAAWLPRHAAWLLPDALESGFQCVRTHWIQGFMAFQLTRRTRTVMLMVSV